jgi:DNA-binding SARP family transcriptional activator
MNLAHVRIAMGQPGDALAHADEAIALLSSSSAGVELVSARLARATALAYEGDINGARVESALAIDLAEPGQVAELALEIGHFEALLGESWRAKALMESVAQRLDPTTDNGEQVLYAGILIKSTEFELASARTDLDKLQFGQPRSSSAFEARRFLAVGLIQALDRDPDAKRSINAGTRLASSQHAHLWQTYGLTLAALADASADPSAAVISAARERPVVLSMLAEVVAARLKDLDPVAGQEVLREAGHKPWRWRSAVRRLLTSPVLEDRRAGASVLRIVGELEDVKRLRDVGRQLRDRNSPKLGFELARRLADHVFVEDLGRVRIMAGSRTIEGGDVRRKVLALLCLLLSKARFASTREEVVDSLWPDLSPNAALNSLNQTVYFLRRVFEPAYEEDTSPGYLGQDGETIWLDSELIDGRSRRCLELIRANPGQPSPEAALALAQEYRGRFALDFAYEEWTTAYRDGLHAGYLRVLELAIRTDLDTGHFGRGTFLAERAMEVDPEAEEIQAALVRLYRLSGAHAAAAEQYAHYAQTMRELGLEPAAYLDV